MLRLTTNVTVSPASSARSSSAAWRISSIASRAGLGEQRRQLLRAQRDARRGPSRSRRATSSGRIGARRVGAARSAPRDEAPVLRLDRVEHALRDPLGVDVLRVDAQALGQRVRRRVCSSLAHLVRRGERVLGGDVIAVGATARRGRSRRRPPARATSRRGSAGPGCRRPASAVASRRSAASCPRCSPRTPTPAAAVSVARAAPSPIAACASTRARPRRRSRRAPAP